MVTATKLAPPVNDPPLQPDASMHSDAWRQHHQDTADALARVSTGVTDGSDAKAGEIGEYLHAASGAVPLTNATLANVVSVDLTAGDWDVSGNVVFSAGSGTHSQFGVGINTIDQVLTATFPSAAITQTINTATSRFNLVSTTTAWLVAQAAFSGTCSVTGTIRARRMR